MIHLTGSEDHGDGDSLEIVLRRKQEKVMLEESPVRRILITVEEKVDVWAMGDIKNMGVDHLIEVMEELFTHLIDVMGKNEKEWTKARKCLREVKQIRKAIEKPEASFMRQQVQVEGCQGTPKEVE